MSVISETLNETYNKHTNLVQSFLNSGGNTYIPFLLPIITLQFTCSENKN